MFRFFHLQNLLHNSTYDTVYHIHYSIFSSILYQLSYIIVHTRHPKPSYHIWSNLQRTWFIIVHTVHPIKSDTKYNVKVLSSTELAAQQYIQYITGYHMHYSIFSVNCVSTMLHNSTYPTSQAIIPHFVNFAKNMVHNSTYCTSFSIRYIIYYIGCFI